MGGEGGREGGREGERGCSQLMHGRSRMAIDPRIPTMPGRSMSSFHQSGRHFFHEARIAVRCSASRMKGELHPSKNRSQDGLRHPVPTFLLMDDSANELYCIFWVGNSRDSDGDCCVTASWVPYHIHTTRCDHSPCVEGEGGKAK